jgi:hypothetical protein
VAPLSGVVQGLAAGAQATGRRRTDETQRG